MPESQVPNHQQPLAGYRVLDLAGPLGVFCGKLMADMGADVIKVEPPGGDPMRGIGPFVRDQPGPERSLHWLHFNTNKRSITLDIGTDGGATLLRRLAGSADAVLETCQPGTLPDLGLGYADLAALNPGLIYVSITPFGQTGPYKDYKGSDLIGLAMGGYMYVTGWPHTPPTRLWGSQAYHTASNRAFVAFLIATFDRLSTGLGQHIDVSLQESVAATTEHVNASQLYSRVSAVRSGFRHSGLFVATWRCKDGYVSITTNTRESWDELRSWMGEEGMAGDLMQEKYDNRFFLRGEYSGHIEELVEKWTMHHTREEITERGQGHHHPWGPAARPSEVLGNPQLNARGFLIEWTDGDLDATFTYPGAPYSLSRSPWKLRSSAPRIGQHNTEVYQTELGLSSSEVEELANGGAL